MSSRWLDSASGRTHLALSFVCGAASNLAFAPFGFYPLIFLTLAVLFVIWYKSSAAICLKSGLLFGFGLYAPGISWLYISVHEFGEAPALFAILVVAALAVLLSLVLAGAGYLQSKFSCTPSIRLIVVIPAIWVFLEWVRSWLFTGFPWLYVGYTQTDSWLVGWASILGVLGVSFAVCVLAGIVASIYIRGMQIGILVPGLLIVLGGLASLDPPWIQTGQPVSAALLQGDVNIRDKWNLRKARGYLEFYYTQSQKLNDVDLVVWPEIALPYTDTRLEKLKLWERLKSLNPDFLVGVLEEHTSAGVQAYYNSAYGISNSIQIYRKSRLVPFGEYTPFRSLLNWLESVVLIPAADFDSYRGRQLPLELANEKIGVSICYEDAFPTDVLRMLPEASILVNISEDAWFGRRLAPAQRLQMSRMRAIETGRPVLRAANQGLSASIDHKGRIIDILSQDEGKVLMTTVRPATGTNPFVLLGNYPVLILCIVSLFVVLRVAQSARTRSDKH